MLTVAFVLCAMQALVFASPLHQEQGGSGTRITLSKRQLSIDDIVNADVLNALLGSVESKYKIGFEAYKRNTGETHPLDIAPFDSNPGSGFNVTRRATGADALTDDNNSELWQGTITVGTPPVTYTVDFDTGSSDLFLPGPACTSNCQGHNQYNPKSSSTAVDRQKTFRLAYGDGSTVSGEQYTDKVSISGLTATKQALGAATTYSNGFAISSFPPDGLLGMGYQSISVYNSPPVFASLVAQGQTTQPVFAFKLAETGSELYLGGVDNNLYTGSFTYASVTTKGYWQVALQAVAANNKVPVQDIQSVIDTGTTLIVGDAQNVKKFYASIPGSKDASSTVGSGYYTVPCSSVPTVSFTFGGKAFSISPSLFNLGRAYQGSKDCVGAIVSSSSLSFWVVGDVFLQNVYTAFDMGNNRVGFATLK